MRRLLPSGPPDHQGRRPTGKRVCLRSQARSKGGHRKLCLGPPEGVSLSHTGHGASARQAQLGRARSMKGHLGTFSKTSPTRPEAAWPRACPLSTYTGTQIPAQEIGGPPTSPSPEPGSERSVLVGSGPWDCSLPVSPVQAEEPPSLPSLTRALWLMTQDPAPTTGPATPRAPAAPHASRRGGWPPREPVARPLQAGNLSLAQREQGLLHRVGPPRGRLSWRGCALSQGCDSLGPETRHTIRARGCGGPARPEAAPAGRACLWEALCPRRPRGCLVAWAGMG